MAGLLYAVKGQSGNPPLDHGQRRRVLEAAGLSFVADLPFDCFGAVIDGEPCWVYNPSAGERAKPKYMPEQQRWEDYGGYWIGSWTAGGYMVGVPQPGDLARADQYWSYALALGDGHKWHVPVVPADLPTTFRMRSGLPVMEVDPRYAGLMAKSGEYWDMERVLRPMREDALALDRQRERIVSELPGLSGDALAAKQDEERKLKADAAALWGQVTGGFPSLEQQCLDCCDLLGLNYYVRPEEVSFLGLLNAKSVGLILYCCFLDRKAVDDAEAAKKKVI